MQMYFRTIKVDSISPARRARDIIHTMVNHTEWLLRRRGVDIRLRVDEAGGNGGKPAVVRHLVIYMSGMTEVWPMTARPQFIRLGGTPYFLDTDLCASALFAAIVALV